MAAAVLGLSFVAGACGGDEAKPTGVAGKDIKTIDVNVPPNILGLPVAKEDVLATVNQVEGRTYVEGNALYSAREPDGLLEATIQITKFTKDSEYKSTKFRRQIVQQIGGSTPETIRVGEDTVYLTASSKQKLYAFFRDRHLVVLTVRETYPQPRNLLRKALEIKP